VVNQRCNSQALHIEVLALAPMTLASNVHAFTLALTPARTIFWHRRQTRGQTTTAKVKLKVCRWQ